MSYDLIVVGGGVTGSALASRLASAGARVLIVERETSFRDRVRGEALQPWGVAEVRKLGIAGILQDTAAELLWFDQILNGELAFHRDMKATTLQGQPMWGFYHPKAQEVLLAHAEACGAEVLRAASLERVVAGAKLKVKSQPVDKSWNTKLGSWPSVVAATRRCAPNLVSRFVGARFHCC